MCRTPFSTLVLSLVALGTLSCSLSVCRAQSQQQPSQDCYLSFTLLEENLLSKSSNRFQLLKTFYPTRISHPVFVYVNYTFTENGSLVEGMSELWYWTVSQFYLIQPLEIFQFTSLFFGNTPAKEAALVLELDRTCAGADPDFMEMLTQRLKLYAQAPTSSVGSSTQRTTDAYTAAAASRNTVVENRIIGDFIGAWMHIFLILFPIGTVLVLYICDPVHLLLGDKTWQKMEDERNHPIIAGLIQVSVLFTVFVFLTDWFGFVYTIKTDYFSASTSAVFFLSVLTGLIVDFLAFGWVVVVLVTSCHWDCRYMWHSWRRTGCQAKVSIRVKKLMGTIMMAPLLCFSNHLYYIVIAWMSDPFHAGSISIIYLFSFFLFYFVFHQFYTRLVSPNYDERPSSRPATPLPSPSASRKHRFDFPKVDSTASTTEFNLHEQHKEVSICRVPFNTQAVLVSLVLVSPLLVLYEGLVLVLFLGLPINKTIEDTPSQIYSIYQGTGILIVALLTYNIVLSPSTFSLPRLVNRLARGLHIADHVDNWTRLGDEEKCAYLLRTVLYSLQNSKVSGSGDGQSRAGIDVDERERSVESGDGIHMSRLDRSPTLVCDQETDV